MGCIFICLDLYFFSICLEFFNVQVLCFSIKLIPRYFIFGCFYERNCFILKSLIANINKHSLYCRLLLDPAIELNSIISSDSCLNVK